MTNTINLAETKTHAKKLFKNNFAPLCGGFLCVALCFMLFDAVVSLLGVFLADVISGYYILPVVVFIGVLISPVINGFFRLCIKLAKNNTANVYDVFYYFSSPSRYFDGFTINILLLLRLIIVAVIFSALPVSLWYLRGFITVVPEYNLRIILHCIWGVMFLAGLLLYSFRYFLVYTIYEENNGEFINACFVRSAKIMNGANIKLVLYNLFSFIPLYLLGIFIIPILCVVPYYILCCCLLSLKIYYAYLRKRAAAQKVPEIIG
ncbi:MAG: hypothetical protein LBM65_07760 [Oscillospiraceae bacterium]|nr:hypothetical protein [Oscillospiraceae bacterium]